jgi:UDP-glucose 4-epimerase
MSLRLPARVAILGCNGYLGSRLAASLLREPDVSLVLGVGRQPAATFEAAESPKFRYVAGDLTRLPLREMFIEPRIECVVHCAFISRPLRDEQEAYRSNVVAATQVFEAARLSGVMQAVLLSSVAVYGPRVRTALATEQDAVWPNGFLFSRHKVLQEHAAFQQSLGGSFALTVLRPCTIIGPGVSNFLLDFFDRPFIPLPILQSPRWQFLHEDDFCQATLALLRHRPAGIFNLAPDDAVPLREAIRLLGGIPVPLPKWLLRVAVSMGWLLRLPFVPGPPEALSFLFEPPLASNAQLRQLTGYQFQRTSREALLSFRSAAVPRLLPT